MKAGHGSKTAVLVCMGRALADSDPSIPSFSDPTAFALLPNSARERVEQVRAGVKPKGLRAAIEHGYLVRQATVMVARTVAIDEAVREAAHHQVVILGAGLDGRAWRMPELAETVVFEVDHPDSQREKRKRLAASTTTVLLEQQARDVRFVSVDFARENLDDALTNAGHDASAPTTWIWEGVVMYLGRPAIEASLEVIARRSAPKSRLVILYHRPALRVNVIAAALRWLGEPLRSSFRPEDMRALLAKYHFEAVRDQSMAEIGSAMSPKLGEATKVAKHLRLVTAERI